MRSVNTIKVLHIDDEKDQRYFTKIFLEKSERISVESEEDHRKVITRISEDNYDCLLSDYQMPSMDGITLAKEIREISDIPIIIYTGKGSEEVASKAFSVGINDYVRKEGDPSHYQVLINRIMNVVAVYQTRKKNEVLMKESVKNQETLRSLIDSLPQSIHLYDHNLNLVNMNKVAAIRGNICFNDIGKNLLDLSPNMKPERYNAYKKVLETGVVYQASNVYDVKEKGLQYVTITAFRVKDGLGIIFNDETRNRLLQEQLMRTETKYRNLWEDSSDGHVLVDKTGAFIDFNSSFMDMIGRSKKELINFKIWDLAPKHLKSVIEQEYLNKASDDDIWNGEVTIYKMDGSHVVLDCLSQPIQLNNQDLIHYRCKLVVDSNKINHFVMDSEPSVEQIAEPLGA